MSMMLTTSGVECPSIVLLVFLPLRLHACLLLQHVELPLVAPSLGGVETLVTRPVLTTHVGLSAAEREAIGIFDGLIRVSVGIEGVDDLLQDFLGALDAAAAEVAV
jgi:cystathionine beta-lyase/cystathionine gamma-synthase